MKTCFSDYAACGGLFGRLKNEMFYYRKRSRVSIEKCVRILDDWIYWYNEKGIKESLGEVSSLLLQMGNDGTV